MMKIGTTALIAKYYILNCIECEKKEEKNKSSESMRTNIENYDFLDVASSWEIQTLSTTKYPINYGFDLNKQYFQNENY